MAAAPDLLGLAGFSLLLVQSVHDLRRRRAVERIQTRIDEMRSSDPADPESAKASAVAVLQEIKAQLERYRPWQGWLFSLGALLLFGSYLWRLLVTA